MRCLESRILTTRRRSSHVGKTPDSATLHPGYIGHVAWMERSGIQGQHLNGSLRIIWMNTSRATPETIEILTCGHSNRTAADFITLVTGHQVTRLVDVRAHPHSRRHPHFNRKALEKALREAGIAYDWLGSQLGGFRKAHGDSANTALNHSGFQGFADYMATEAFSDAIETLLGLASSGGVAIMCAEADYLNCHRQFIADALSLRSATVKHITSAVHAIDHALNPCLGDARDPPVYNRNEQGDLFT